eukprot:472610-Heterocapsa_arctica.AAC.1
MSKAPEAGKAQGVPTAHVGLGPPENAAKEPAEQKQPKKSPEDQEERRAAKAKSKELKAQKAALASRPKD